MVLFFIFYFYLLLRHPATMKRRPAPTPPPSLANASRGWVFPSPTIRPTKVGRPQQPTKANAGSQQPTQAHEGPQQPTQAHEGPQQLKRWSGFIFDDED